MLIGEFAPATGLPADTIRFYVRKGLLVSETGGKGGRNPYQIFSEAQISRARMIRLIQSFGLSLKDVDQILRELQQSGLAPKKHAALLRHHLERLESKEAEIHSMADYLRRKVTWLDGGQRGPEPDMPVCLSGTPFCYADVLASVTETPQEKSRRPCGNR